MEKLIRFDWAIKKLLRDKANFSVPGKLGDFIYNHGRYQLHDHRCSAGQLDLQRQATLLGRQHEDGVLRVE